MNLANLGAIAIGLLLGLMTILFIFRIVLTWYPQAETTRFPFNVVVAITEPFLSPLRKIIAPIGGVDITPVILVGVCTLLREILVGQQGLITMAIH